MKRRPRAAHAIPSPVDQPGVPGETRYNGAMAIATTYASSLPLSAEPGHSRVIRIDSCRVDDTHVQVRGELADHRADFEQPDRRVEIHGLVVRVTIDVSSGCITEAEFGLPRMAFASACEHLPVGAEQLIGVKVGRGFLGEIRERFEGQRSCWHLYTLLNAIAPTMNQCLAWNHGFRYLDEHLLPDGVPAVMEAMTERARNSCHAWADEGGAIQEDFRRGAYERMLSQIGRRVVLRWKKRKG